MKTKLASILAMLLCIALLIVPLASCDDDGSSVETTEKPADTSAPDTSAPDTSAPDTDSPATGAPETSAPETNAPDTNAPETSAPVTSAPDTDTPETSAPTTEDKPVIVDKAGWENMLSDKNFENYTLTMEGRMTVTQDGQNQGTSDVRDVMKITADKVEIIAYAEDVNSPADDSFTIVVEGEDAEAQKVQISQIFMAILGHYESFVFDPLTGNYTVPETLTIEAVLKGISYSSDGEIKTFDVPSTLVIREAIATISADGQLLTFVCDYTQTMNVGGSEISTSGKTTWTFSDYGTTVIE